MVSKANSTIYQVERTTAPDLPSASAWDTLNTRISVGLVQEREDRLELKRIKAGTAPFNQLYESKRIERQYQWNPHEGVQPSVTPPSRSDFRETRGLEIPAVDVNAPHTLNAEYYLGSRYSETVLDLLRNDCTHRMEIFAGEQNEMQQFYISDGWTLRGHVDVFGEPAAQTLFEKDGEFIWVTRGVVSESYLKNLVLQLHFQGVDITNKVRLRGDIQAYQTGAAQKLTSDPEFSKNPPEILFIGQNTQIKEFLGQYLGNNPDMVYRSGEPGKATLKANKEQLQEARFEVMGNVSTTLWTLPGEDGAKRVATLSAMNGELSGVMVDAFIESGVKKVILNGAVGSLSPDLKVAAYQESFTAQYGDKQITIPGGNRLSYFGEHTPDLSFDVYPEAAGGSSITVDSAMEETEAWLEESKHHHSVDVELFHTLSAINEALKLDPKRDLKVFSGGFISDLVGDKGEQLENGFARYAFTNFGLWLSRILEAEGVTRF